MNHRLHGRGWIAGLLLLVGVNAVAAGYGFVGTPDGSALGIPQDWLAGTPFQDYLIPGLILAGLGVLSLVAATLQLRRHPVAWAWAGVSGLGFITWIVAQAILMGSFRHPAQTILQAVVLAVGIAVTILAFRQFRDWHLRWGATHEEFTRAMPGDGHVLGPHFNPTRAITIRAPPENVWPWLVQMGFGRAGFYSYDLLDNAAKPSLSTLDPRLQQLKVGDWIPMAKKITETTAFRVAALDSPRSMVWTKPDSSWAWELLPLPGGGTRLLTRIRLNYEASPLLPITLLLMEVGDFPMMRKCLLGIKKRAEQTQAR